MEATTRDWLVRGREMLEAVAFTALDGDTRTSADASSVTDLARDVEDYIEQRLDVIAREQS